MDKKSEFKNFIKKNPHLVTLVTSNKYTWQQLYEVYDIYGEDNSVWSKYKVDDRKEEETNQKETKKSLKDILASLKKIDVDSLQEGLEGIGKAASLLEELTNKSSIKSEEKKAKKIKETTIERFFDD